MPQELLKWLLMGYALAVAIAVVYVPWTYSVIIPFGEGAGVPVHRREYSWIFSSPFSGAGTIDFLAVFLELIAITAIVGVAFLVLAFSKRDKP